MRANMLVLRGAIMKRVAHEVVGVVVMVFLLCLAFSQIGFAAVIRVMPTGSDVNS
jgi:hypothetical protein